MASPNTPIEVLYISFNQSLSCFSCGHTGGFIIYDCDPLKERFRRNFPAPGGIGIVEMLYKCNILALVGGGPQPKYPPNKVVLWDDFQSASIGDLEFRTVVRAVRLHRERVVVVLDYRIYIYSFNNLTLMYQIDTYPNNRGLCAINTDISVPFVIACPGRRPGVLHIEIDDMKKQFLVQAHVNMLSQIVLNASGTKAATASEKGTLIRIFDTTNGTQISELRRGISTVNILSMNFDVTSSYLVVTSDKVSVHVYGLNRDDKNEGNRQTALRYIPFLPSYFYSEWSFAQCHLLGGNCISAFGPEPNTIIIISKNGGYYKYSYDTSKGIEAKQEVCSNFL